MIDSASLLTITSNINDPYFLSKPTSYASAATIVVIPTHSKKVEEPQEVPIKKSFYNQFTTRATSFRLKKDTFSIARFINHINLRSDQHIHSKTLKKYGEVKKHQQHIGMGASATVKLVYNGTTTFAVKVFKKNRETNSRYMKKLISEFCISSTLNHPNVIKTIDLVVDEKNRYCTIMEYCSGGDLYSYIKDHRVSMDEANGFIVQILNGLDYLHELGVAHRDMKPENILLVRQADQSIVLKITDFGEADVYRDVYQQNVHLSDGLCGSTPYIAPEIFLKSKQGYRASQCDVWSTAIVYFSMRVNGVPFYSAQMSDCNYRLFTKHYTTESYPAFQSFDVESRAMMYAMMNPDPEKRYTVRDVLKLTWLAEVQPPTLL